MENNQFHQTRIKNITLSNKVKPFSLLDTGLSFVSNKHSSKTIIFGIFVSTFVLFFPNISYEAPGDQCFEQENVLTACGCFNGISGIGACVLKPFDVFLAPYTLAVIWGGLLGVIWFRSQSPLLVAVVGIIVATTAVGLNQTAVGIGMMLASVAIGVVLFQVIRQRTSVLSF